MTKINPQSLINVNGKLINPNEVHMPDNRIFRDAWVSSSEKIVEVDMNLAREIQKDRVRVERQEKFKELDSEWFIASESNDTEKLQKIKEKKQILRDITKSSKFKEAKKPKELSKLTLKYLTGF